MKNNVEICHDKIAENYDTKCDNDLYMKLYEDITWDNIKRFLPKNKNSLILDAGGGTGRWGIKIAKLGYNVVLTDISKGMLKVAEKKIKKNNLSNKIKIVGADIKNMKMFQDEKFDLVLSEGDPLSYCGDYKKALKELTRVLKKGGYLIASVDNRITSIYHLIKQKKFDEIKNFLRTGNIVIQDSSSYVDFPIHTFTQKELKKLFAKNSLKVLRLTGKPVLLNKIIDKMLENKKSYKNILKLCIRLADNPDYINFAGHLEIVGLK
ncbi:MAG: methyltransferase domain-containing protein [Candidatus Thermoplasmatota archaeon]|nr:methyltransferase domain-containing protein [Candidatus Thermoplasmatota archaeon]